MPREGFEVRDGLETTEYVVRMQPTAEGVIVPYRDEADLSEEIKAFSLDSPGARWLVAKGMMVGNLFPDHPAAHEMCEKVVTTYWPLKMGGLHRDFAALSLDERAVTAFADRYGLLGYETWHVVTKGEDLLAEPIELWFEAIRTMREIVRLWDLYRDPDAKTEDFYKVVYDDADYANMSLEEVDEGVRLSHWIFTNVMLPHPHTGRGEAQYRYSAGMVLSGVVSAALSALALPMVEVRKGGQINLVPQNLLGALYVLLAQEIMGRTEPPIRCGACGRWFDARHASRRYCSDACKMKAYRQTKKNKTEAES